MGTVTLLEQAKLEGWSDEEVVRRIRDGETALYEIIMRRYNQRLYRVARAILHSDVEAEDVMQDAYVRAYQHLDQYSGRAPFGAWLTKIAVNEALARLRSRGRIQELEAMFNGQDDAPVLMSNMKSPEQQVSSREMNRLLEEAILALPGTYRTVLMMRDVEEMTTADTAAALELTEENVKVRLHRARALLRKELFNRAGTGRNAAFPFLGPRCDNMVQTVFGRLANIHNR
ncbi:MAG TPA: RNA polymerase sigma factor [Terriglobales bacterium]|nr:RNA polymerase sigma factor [Terriglobales bacterium]